MTPTGASNPQSHTYAKGRKDCLCTVPDDLEYTARASVRPSDPTDRPTETIMVNLTRQIPFGILAGDTLPDLCVTGRQTRCLPRQSC